MKLIKHPYSLVLIEIAAVILNLGYTWMYLHEDPRCWYLAGAGSALFVILCCLKKLYAETVLQIFYVGFAVYGLLVLGDEEWVEEVWATGSHALLILLGAVLVTGAGTVLRKRTDAKLPYLDSFTTVYSILATWVMVNYVHENWLYWIVIDSVSIYLYARRKMYFGAILFFIYLLLAIDGYWSLGWF